MQKGCRWEEMELWKIFAVKAEEYLGPNVVIKTVGLAHFWKATRVLLTQERGHQRVRNVQLYTIHILKVCGSTKPVVPILDGREAGKYE